MSPTSSASHLPAGTYNFFVKTRNKPGFESTATSYSFVILPPWHQTWWAYAAYILLAMICTYPDLPLAKEKIYHTAAAARNLHQLELEKNEKEIVKLRK